MENLYGLQAACLVQVLPPKKANLPEVPPKKEMLATQEEAQVHLLNSPL